MNVVTAEGEGRHESAGIVDRKQRRRFFMSKTVLSGGNYAYSVDTYLQVYNDANKPSLRGRTGIFCPPAAEGGLLIENGGRCFT